MNEKQTSYLELLVNVEANERLANLIRKLRGDKSQRLFAKSLGVSYAAVRSWEEAESMPGLKSLEKIAAYSNQKVEDILSYLKYNKDVEIDPDARNIPVAKIAEDLYPQVKNLNKSEKSKLAKFLINELSKS